MFPLLGLTFAMPFNIDLSSILWVAMAIGVYLIVAKFTGPVAAAGILAKLAPRATNLLRFIDSLGLPALAPILTKVGEGKWTEVAQGIHSFFDQLDDKATRRQILFNLARTLVTDHLKDPAKKDGMLSVIEEALNIKIPRAPSS